jgi:hypothetical protein
MNPAGFFQTPLIKKLGIKNGFQIRLVNPPNHYFELFERWPDNVTFSENRTTQKDMIHYFTARIGELETQIQLLKKEIKPNGMIWVSWPKKTSKVQTDVTENTIRAIALANGLVDVKVCALDSVWSALKLVIPVNDRRK